MPYELTEHTHRFSIWAGARAAHRGKGGFYVDEFSQAMELSGVAEKLWSAAKSEWTHDSFGAEHMSWCATILPKINELKDVRIESEREAVARKRAKNPGKNFKEPDATKVSFGRVAKAVNVYVKAAFVLGGNIAHRSFVDVAHPPVDRELLEGVKAAFQKGKFGDAVSGDRAIREQVRNLNAAESGWTSFDAEGYRDVINLLKRLNGSDRPFWRIEEYWDPTD